MGKKKAFIDKKKAQTFSLVFRSAEDTDEVTSERILFPQDGAGADQPPAAGPHQPPTSDPRALYRHFFGEDGGDDGDGQPRAPLPEARRKELLEFGFPDDGYDYLSHCRVIGRGAARMERPAGRRPVAELREGAAAAGTSAAAAAEEAKGAEPAAAAVAVGVYQGAAAARADGRCEAGGCAAAAGACVGSGGGSCR